MKRRSTLTPALVVALAAAPALAHGPVQRKPVQAPPGTVFPLSKPVQPSDLAPSGSSPGVPTTGVRPLRLLAADAAAIVVADVTRSESYDEDRLQVHRLRVVRVLRGKLDAPEPGVVEMRSGTQRPPLLSPGQRVVVLLRPVRSLSYLREHLPDGQHFETVAGRDGIIPVGGGPALDAVEQTLAASAAASDQAARRQLAFTELRSGNPRLVADALLELRELQTLAPLTTEEVDLLARVLRDESIDAVTRAGLITLAGERGLTETLPALRGASIRVPMVLDAVLAARVRLGAPADRTELKRFLEADDPAVRAVAVRALARLDDPAAVSDLGHYATDAKDTPTRVAAIEGLGASGKPTAVPILVGTFRSSEREVKQASARALLEIGGPVATDALVDLALRGDSVETQTYAALLLLVSKGPEDPAVRRMVESNPSPEVKKLLEQGIEFRHTHKHQ